MSVGPQAPGGSGNPNIDSAGELHHAPAGGVNPTAYKNPEYDKLYEQAMVMNEGPERDVLYKKMEKSDDEKARSFAFEGTNEHQIVEQQLKQMSRARNKASEQWTAQLTVLKELVNHHVKEEESTGFSCARSEFDREELEKFGEQFRRQKEKLMAEA